MLKRTLFFSNPFSLGLRNQQIVIKPKGGQESLSIPIEDVGFLVLEHSQIHITLPLIEALIDNNVAVVFCNSKHHPQSMLLNLDSNHMQTEVFRKQINASLPLKKNLWKQTVEAKLVNQANCLKLQGEAHSDILAFSRNVKSGDPENREGTAARIYWPRLFGGGFSRDRFGKPPNNLLNYGYSILRAAVARALSGSGLLPTLGIHHRNKYNAYCLADDIMEPYRPFVDRRVLNIYVETGNHSELTKENKAELLSVLSDDVLLGKTRRPLMIALSQTTASLSRCFGGKIKRINYGILQ